MKPVIIALTLSLICIQAYADLGLGQLLREPIQEIVPYGDDSKIQSELQRYHLTANVHQIVNGTSTNRLPYLLYKPQIASPQKLPLLVYLAGTGETGQDLSRHFRQRTLFEIITSQEFQERHPCYLFAPMLSNHRNFFGAVPKQPTDDAARIFQSLRTLISSLGSKAIDPNRIYITGFSFGGCAAFEMVCFYPRVFAAGLPISSVESEYILPTDIAVNLWCIENRMTISKERESLYQRMKERVANTGGDFRVSFYPKPNHDAWTAAWKEDALWDWLFSKHRSANRNTTKVNQPNPFHTYKCESNISPKANQFAPRYGADGLKGTCFKADNAKNGSWWQLTSSDMLSGTITLIMGKAKDVATYPHCVIEASRDSFHWRRITNTNIHSDKTIFTLQEPVLHIRIRYTGTKPQMFIIREVSEANQPMPSAKLNANVRR